MEPFPDSTTWLEKYGPAMKVSSKDEAAEYLAECVAHTIRANPGISYSRACEVERKNLAYFAGYYDHETRLRVEELFDCEHPYIGAAKDGEKSMEELFQIGYDLGKKLREEQECDQGRTAEAKKSGLLDEG